MIYAVRVTAGRERQVIEKLEALMNRGNYAVYSILYPHRVKGYFFVEADSLDEVKRLVYGVHYIKGVVQGELKLEDVEHFLAPSEIKIELNKGDIVELIAGPFRGEKAKVLRVNKQKEEVVVELLEAAVPIPVTVKLDSVRVIKKG